MTSFKRTQRKYVQKAYRVRNWREYETGLRARGSLTVWLGLTDGKLANWNSPRPTRRKPDASEGTGVPESRGEVGVQDSEHHDGARDTRWRDDRMTGRRSHGRLSALNGVVHQGITSVQSGSPFLFTGW